MPAPTRSNFNDAISKFITALINADKAGVRGFADKVFAKAYPKLNAGDNDPYLEPNTRATYTMLEALKFAISAQERLLNTQHPRLGDESKEFLSQAKEYAYAANGQERAHILTTLVTQYSENARSYNLGCLDNKQAKELLDETRMRAEANFKEYCSSLLKKLESVELIDEAERSDFMFYLKFEKPYYEADNSVDNLIRDSLELIELSKKIDDSIKKVKPQFAAENAKSIGLAQKLVDCLFELVELISSLGNRLKVILGLEEEGEQRKNLLWKQFKDRNPEVLDNANKSKHTLELVTEELNSAQRRVERGSRGELV